MLAKKVSPTQLATDDTVVYATRYFSESCPSHKLAARGMPAAAAYQLIHDELNLDGNPALNLATFVTTWMEPEAARLIEENLYRNYIDHDEYPQTAQIEQRVVNMLAHLFHAPPAASFAGTSTIGSSEAVMLGGLAMKWRWKERRSQAGQSVDRPNLVMGADAHVVWEKLCRYFEIEPRIVPLSQDSYILTAEKVAAQIDEQTIGVAAVLGTTYTGQIDEITAIDQLLVQTKKERGWDIPIHVDAANGGFVLPFIAPEFRWDFRLPQVRSINVSGHKFGLVYPGVGWLIFRDIADLPPELIFYVDYLGDVMPTYTLNFSRGSAMMLAQYYNLLRLGREGYTRIMRSVMKNTEYLTAQITATGKFTVTVSKPQLPILTFAIKGDRGFNEFDLSARLRQRGWIVPAYTLPAAVENTRLLRIVIKENFSRDLAERLLTDLCDAFTELEQQPFKEVSTAKRRHRGSPIC